MTKTELATIGALCTLLGAMLGGGALGAARVRPTTEPAQRQQRAQESNPETVGDGVLLADPIDDEPVSAARWMATTESMLSALTHVAPATTAARPNGRRRGGSGGVTVTSDHVPEGPAQGYVEGRPTRIVVTRLDAKPVELRTAAAFVRMRNAAQRDHVTLRIVSGFRTMEHQQALYAAYRNGRGNLAAVPGQSNHQSGHALDLNTSTPGVRPWLDRNARRFGFRRTVASEPWHWEWW